MDKYTPNPGRAFHLLVKTSTENTSDMKHYFVVSDRPSRAVAILENEEGWKAGDKITVETAEPQGDSSIKLDAEAIWRI